MCRFRSSTNWSPTTLTVQLTDSVIQKLSNMLDFRFRAITWWHQVDAIEIQKGPKERPITKNYTRVVCFLKFVSNFLQPNEQQKKSNSEISQKWLIAFDAHNRRKSIIQNDSCHRLKTDKKCLNLKPGNFRTQKSLSTCKTYKELRPEFAWACPSEFRILNSVLLQTLEFKGVLSKHHLRSRERSGHESYCESQGEAKRIETVLPFVIWIVNESL